MVNSNPTASLADSINSFSKSALRTLKDLENQLAQAVAEARQARTERDSAVKLTHASQLETEAQKQDVLTYKSSLMQAELTIEHQTDLITQLHREVNHWKEQARNWQEHFTRVEQERCSLSTRLDELVTGHFQGNASIVVPVTAKHIYTDIDSSISSTTTKQTPSAHHAAQNEHVAKSTNHTSLSQPDEKSPLPPRKALDTPDAPKLKSKSTTSRKQKIQTTTPAQSTNPRKSAARPSAVNAPQQNLAPEHRTTHLVRRVQAIIQVKSEDEEQDIQSLPSDSASINGKDEQPVVPRSTKQKPSIVRRKSRMLIRDEDDDDDELPNNNAPTHDPANGKSNFVESDGEDELMLGHDGTHPSAQNRQRQQVATAPPIKKRKLSKRT
ncbi:hypothetical protein AX17_006271 [Amanita inopinata Kibby_2008]|nr:hypothetical protein AX17_006271 [Amanita inopinata Kibby_2008]